MLQMFIVHSRLFKHRQLPSSRNGIPDLPSIHFMFRQRINMSREICSIDTEVSVARCWCRYISFPFLTFGVGLWITVEWVGGFKTIESLDEIRPDWTSLPFLEILVVECELDSGLERFVERSDAIAGENENSCLKLVYPSGRWSKGSHRHNIQAPWETLESY